VDLAAVSGFDRERFYGELRQVNSDVPVIEVSSRTGAGFEDWLGWLERFAAGVKKQQPG
jgi:hydrogenase nickel incorporation protein HypB